MDLELAGRVAVVTGASKGIGLAVTEALLREGARVVGASRSTSAELDALEGDLVHVAVDLMDPDAPAAVVRRAVDEFEGLDILVNNAGGPPPGDYGVATTRDCSLGDTRVTRRILMRCHPARSEAVTGSRARRPSSWMSSSSVR